MLSVNIFDDNTSAVVCYQSFCNIHGCLQSTEKLGTEELGKEKEITQNNNRRDEYIN